VNFDRITIDREVMGGAPCIRGLRIPVATVISMLADGMTAQEIVNELPALEEEDIRQSLRYATRAMQERHLPLHLDT
jgi:uncharacterized protein (DUF433 family)